MRPVRRFSFYAALLLSAIVLLSCNLPLGNDLPSLDIPEIDAPEIENPEITVDLDDLDDFEVETPDLSDLPDEDPDDLDEEEQEPPPVSDLGATYQDPDGFYTIQYPADWVEQRSGSQQQFCTDAQAGSCVAVSLGIKQVSAQSFKEAESTWLSQNIQGYQEFEEKEVTVSGLPGVHVEQGFSWNDIPNRGFMILTVRNRIGFELMAWTPENDYPDLQETFMEIARSFQLLPQPQSPLYQEWKTYQSDHLTFNYLPGTWIDDSITAIADDHEWSYQQVQDALGVSFSGQITYYLYTSPESLYQSTARDSGFAINEHNEVHSLWQAADDHQTLGHEMTHVITYQSIGDPSEALLGEGIAVCLDQSGRDYRQIGKDWKDSGSLVPLNDMLGDAWFSQDSTIAYQESGSFACYLLEIYGAGNFKRLYPQADFAAEVQSTLDTSLDQLEQDWHAWLDGR